ncbi:MAG: hypothetical protein HY011_00240 [Acidobacteria bacterium]|nr:hypothetical protein [Acidobacteriota bacterium]
MRWARAGRALLWASGHAQGYYQTIRLQPLDGGAPQTLLELPDQKLYWFDLSPDGQRLAYISGNFALSFLLVRELD